MPVYIEVFRVEEQKSTDAGTSAGSGLAAAAAAARQPVHETGWQD